MMSMAIPVEQLYYKYQEKFQISLIAGKEGIEKLVQWVHIVESDNVDGYISGGELVMTTGVPYKEKSWLTNLVKSLQSNNACGIIVNLGHNIESIDREVIDFCNENKFPLLTIPWHVQLVHLTKEFANEIVGSEQHELSISEAFKNAIYYSETIEQYQSQLERYGFEQDSDYCVIAIGIECYDEEKTHFNIGLTKYNIKQILNKVSEKYSILTHNNLLILILKDIENDAIIAFIEAIEEELILKKTDFTFHMGIGNILRDITNLGTSYKQANSSYKMANKNKAYHMFYKDMGVYKLLISMEKDEILEELYYEVLGDLIEFDKANNTEYINFLREYINHNSSVQELASSMFVHRNTINYKIKKIKEITGYDMIKEEDKFKIMLALKIQDIL